MPKATIGACPWGYTWRSSRLCSSPGSALCQQPGEQPVPVVTAPSRGQRRLGSLGPASRRICAFVPSCLDSLGLRSSLDTQVVVNKWAFHPPTGCNSRVSPAVAVCGRHRAGHGSAQAWSLVPALPACARGV